MNEFKGYEHDTNVGEFNAYLSKVFTWMFAGLAMSFAVAYISSHSISFIRFLYGAPFSMLILIGVEFFLVYSVSRNITRYSYAQASGMFMLYSFVNGLTLSGIFIAYNLGTIANAFISAGIVFGIMAVYGKVTTRDLRGLQSFLMMGVAGLIVAILVNMFLQSSAFDLVISGVGVFIFAGLTAYDMQKIEDYYTTYGNTNLANNTAIMGALALYLDFINLFIFLLRIFGSRRD